MTREEYLQECANSYLAKTYELLDSCDIEFISCIIDAFEAGAKWADANPIQGDLSRMWHPAEEEPQTGRQIVAINGIGVSFSGVYWPYNAKGYVPKYPGVYWNGGGCLNGARLLDWQEAVKWAYIEDLLPKGGDQ